MKNQLYLLAHLQMNNNNPVKLLHQPMKKFRYCSVFLGLMLMTLNPLAAQDDNVILRAMKDEMARSLTEITYEGHEKPFYISYGILDSKTFIVFSSTGSLVRSNELKKRQKSVRIMVGSYEFNDESLDDDASGRTLAAKEIEVPLDDDYYGIRRALWTTTDGVYKAAAQKYKKHQETLREKNKSIGDLPHRTFAKVPIVEVKEKPADYTFDKIRWENYCKDLSASFKNNSDLENADVYLTFRRDTKYFVNSEGTTVVKPEGFAVVQCRVQLKAKNGVPNFDQFVYYGETPEQLPSPDQIKKEGERIMEKLKQKSEIPQLEDDYTGPVLFIGYPVAQAFANASFSFREGLHASNTLPSKDNARLESGTSLESRLGKSVMDNSITVKATPRTKIFKGIPLLGSFSVDDEGVVPPEELILIEKGILKNLLNDRTITKAEQTANGFSSGPGVIQVSVGEGLSLQTLKEKLIAAAREEGLDYAIIVRGSPGQAGQGEIFKVSLDTGKEEPLSQCRVNNLALKNLKHVFATKDQTVQHVPLGPGGLSSLIVPEALLVLQADVTPLTMSVGKEEETVYVPSPLKK